MTRDQFLSQLRKSLGNMPEADKEDIVYDYEEHFRIGLADGKSEAQIAESLGNPRVIGNSYRIDAMLNVSKEGGGVTTASVFCASFRVDQSDLFQHHLRSRTVFWLSRRSVRYVGYRGVAPPCRRATHGVPHLAGRPTVHHQPPAE